MIRELPSGLLVEADPKPDRDLQFTTLLRVTVLDTATGESATDDGNCTWWWTEGNGSCDCNRELMFEDSDSETCLGCVRFRVVAVEPLLPGYTLADFNQGYPPV